MKILLLFCVLFYSCTAFSQEFSDIDNMISSERYEEAFTALQLLQKKEPLNSYLYFGLGETAMKSYLNDPYSESKASVVKHVNNYFSTGIQNDSLNPLNYVGMGMLELFNMNDTLKADLYFLKANKLIPTKKKKINELHIKTLLKLETAELYANAPRYYKSANYFNTLKELYPKLPGLYIGYGDILMSQKDASGAIASYKKALYLQNNALSNVLVGRIYFLARNYEEAKTYYDAALKLDSLIAPAYKGLGDVYYKQNKNTLAKTNYARFLELAGNNIPAKLSYINALYKGNDFDEAIHESEDVLMADSSKIYLNRLVAYSLVDKPKPDMLKALDYLQKFIVKTPKDELIIKDYTYYSKILLSLKRDSLDIRDGIKMLEKAYLADTSNNGALIELIKTAYTFKVYDIEIKYLEKKINSSGVSIGNYMLLGKAYYHNKEFIHADSIFRIVTKMDSSFVEAYQWECYALLPQDPDLKEGIAKPVYERILQLTNHSDNKNLQERYEAFTYLGSCYMFSKIIDYNKAIEYIKGSIDLDVHNDKWQLKSYYTLAYAYYKSKQWLNAKTAYEMVLILKPNDANAKKALKDIDKYLAAK